MLFEHVRRASATAQCSATAAGPRTRWLYTQRRERSQRSRNSGALWHSVASELHSCTGRQSKTYIYICN